MVAQNDPETSSHRSRPVDRSDIFTVEDNYRDSPRRMNGCRSTNEEIYALKHHPP